MRSKVCVTDLQHICKNEKGAIISGPFGSNISKKYFVEKGVPVIRGNNLPLGLEKFNDEGFVFITEKKADELRCDAFQDDLIFTAAGTIGQVGIIPKDAGFIRYVISNYIMDKYRNFKIGGDLLPYLSLITFIQIKKILKF